MAELNTRLNQEDTKLRAERAQHNAAAKDLMLAQEEVLELKRRVRVAVCSLTLSASHRLPRHQDPSGGVFCEIHPAR